MIRYGIWLKVEVQVTGIAPALGIEWGRKGGDKDKSEFSMSNRVNGIIIFRHGGTRKEADLPCSRSSVWGLS